MAYGMLSVHYRNTLRFYISPKNKLSGNFYQLFEGKRDCSCVSLMSVCTFAPDFCLHFGRTRTMRASDVLLFLCLGLYLRVCGRLVLLWTSTEGDSIKDYLADIVSTWYHR